MNGIDKNEALRVRKQLQQLRAHQYRADRYSWGIIDGVITAAIIVGTLWITVGPFL